MIRTDSFAVPPLLYNILHLTLLTFRRTRTNTGTSSIEDPPVPHLSYLQHHNYTPTRSLATRNNPANHTRHPAT